MRVYRAGHLVAVAVSRVIGLTGGIGSGKSVVARLLGERGAAVIDADTTAHQVYRAGTEGWSAIVAAFGREILDADGNVSRSKLGGIVFNDAAARNRLNAIVHPQVRRLLSDQVARVQRRGGKVVVVEVPLLIEAIRSAASWTRMFDEVWVVAAPEAEVIDRVRARGGMSEATIRAVIEAQVPPKNGSHMPTSSSTTAAASSACAAESPRSGTSASPRRCAEQVCLVELVDVDAVREPRAEAAAARASALSPARARRA